MRRMIRPTVKTPHAIASPIIKGVHVQVIGHLEISKPVGNSLNPQPAGLWTGSLNREGGPNADIIDPLASVAERIVASPAGIKELRALGNRFMNTGANNLPL